MECKQCGYVMQEYEAECPRCSRLKAKGAAVPGPRQAAAAAGPAVPRYMTQREPIPDGPEYGWPLTILIWTVLLMNGGEVLFYMLVMFLGLGANAGAFTVGLLMNFSPIIGIVALIYILKGQRWGVYVYAGRAVMPAFMGLMFMGTMEGSGGILSKLLILVVDILPALAIFVMVMNRWDQFE